MNTEFLQLRELADRFLETADRLNERVSAYLDGSDKNEDIKAYHEVIEANATFNRAYANYYGEPMMKPSLDYELAESVL